MKKNKGFTIIEIIVTITIVTIMGTLILSNVNQKTSQDYVASYYNNISFRMKEVFDKVLSGKGISSNLKYVKISCNTSDRDIFAYNCYEDLSGNISCDQIFFPTSYISSNKLNKSGMKSGFLKQCGYYDLLDDKHDLNNFYYYIDTKFPYKVYKKLNDDGVLSDYNNTSDSNLNINDFYINIGYNSLIEEKRLNF